MHANSHSKNLSVEVLQPWLLDFADHTNSKTDTGAYLKPFSFQKVNNWLLWGTNKKCQSTTVDNA